MTDRDLMQQALEALEIEREWQDGPVPHLDAALTTARQTLGDKA